MRRNFQRIVAWLAFAGVFWVAGATSEGDVRLGIWAVALGIEFISPSLGFWTPGLGRSTTADWQIDGAHMAERCGLFVIIALGESLLVTGATFAGLEWHGATVLALLSSLTTSAAMWWLYFDTTADVGHHAITRSQDPGRLARLAYTYLHLPLVGGIVLSAVGDEFVLAHPIGHVEMTTAVAVLGSAAMFLAGLWCFRMVTSWRATASAPVGIAVLALLWMARGYLSPVVLLAAVALLLVCAATWDAYRCKERVA